MGSSVGSGTAHGRRYTPRPHPGRGSAAIARSRRAVEARVADSRIRGASRKVARSARSGQVAREELRPGGGIAVARRDDDARQLDHPTWLVPGRQLEERLGRQDQPEVGRPVRGDRPRRGAPRACRRCTTARPGRSRGDRPRTAGSRRSPARPSPGGARRRCRDEARLVRRLAGRDEHDPLEPERLRRLLGNREMRDVDRVERPAEDAERARHDRRWTVGHVRSQGCASHSSSAAPDPHEVAGGDPGAAQLGIDPQPGQVALEPLRRLLDVEVGLGGDPLDPRPAHPEHAVGVDARPMKPSVMVSMRWTTTPAGSGGSAIASAGRAASPRSVRGRRRARRPGAPRSRRPRSPRRASPG